MKSFNTRVVLIIIIYLSAAMGDKNKDQPPILTENIFPTSSRLQQFEIKMQTKWKKYTEQTLRQIYASQIEIDSMSLKDLNRFAGGLAMFKDEQTKLLTLIKEEITKKEKVQKNNEPTTAEIAQNWWAATMVIYISVISVISGGLYTASQILALQSKEEKWTLLVILILLIIGVFAANWCWTYPRRNIYFFKGRFNEKDIKR